MSKYAKIFWGAVIIIGLLIIASLIVSRFVNFTTGSYDTGGYYGGEMEMGMMAPAADFGLANRSAAPTMAKIEMSDEVMAEEPATSGQTTERLIIKTGSFSVVVDNVNAAVDTITKYAVDQGGFVVSSNIYKESVSPYAVVTVRIPVDIFVEGVGEIKKLGEVKSESIDGQDVTEEYVDLEAQLKNLQAAENQFLEIMKKAVKIEDILAVQRELTNVRDRIERIQGRMKYLSESAHLSTLTINLSTDPDMLPVVDEEDKWKPFGVFKEAARGLLDVGKALSYLIIWLVVYIPLWLVIILFGWIGYRIIKRLFRGKKEV